MAEVLLDIAQNASIRGMRVDGVDLFSLLDFITYVFSCLSRPQFLLFNSFNNTVETSDFK
jgi:hypothetical protein